MANELVICIPGTWRDRKDFVQQVVAGEPVGRYMFAGMLLVDIEAKEHVQLEFSPADLQIAEAFEIAGQGKLPPEVLARLAQHTSVVYLLFPPDLPGQRERLLKFTEVVQRLGGIAVKVESTGLAHTWDRWAALLSGTHFDLYRSGVVIVGDADYYYSCGMHLFGLPECEVPRSIAATEAADLVNRFNFWRIVEHPEVTDGHTFSLTPTDPHFQLSLVPDLRHEPKDLFYNAYGVWRLDAA